jgi:DUF177 domain-containing protein
MPPHTDSFDLGQLDLDRGEGRRLDLHTKLEPLDLSGQDYAVQPDPVGLRLDVSRMTGGGYSLRLRFSARVAGPCMRCLEPAAPAFEIDAREVDQPGGGEELDSPYVGEDGLLDLHGWAHDALSLALPAQLLCRPECAGLCPVCGADLNAHPGHEHEREPDPRWAKLRELKLE